MAARGTVEEIFRERFSTQAEQQTAQTANTTFEPNPAFFGLCLALGLATILVIGGLFAMALRDNKCR